MGSGGDRFTICNSGTALYGSGDNDTVTISTGMSGIILDQNIERINFSGTASNYKFKQTGNIINVYDTTDKLIVKIPVQGGSNGTILSFGNLGTASAVLSGGVMTLGGLTVNPVTASGLSPALR